MYCKEAGETKNYYRCKIDSKVKVIIYILQEACGWFLSYHPYVMSTKIKWIRGYRVTLKGDRFRLAGSLKSTPSFISFCI